MRRRAALSIALASLALAFAPAPLPRKTQAKLPPSMEGEWLSEDGGRLVITATRFVVSYGTERADVALTVDRTREPPAFDIRTAPRTTMAGIYRVQGDRLLLTYNLTEGRPIAFEGEGVGQVVEEYRRIR